MKTRIKDLTPIEDYSVETTWIIIADKPFNDIVKDLLYQHNFLRCFIDQET